MSDPDFDSCCEVDVTALNANRRVLTGVELAHQETPRYIGKPDLCGIHRHVGLSLDSLIEKLAAGRCHSIIATLHEDGWLSIDYNALRDPAEIKPFWPEKRCPMVTPR